MRYLDRFLPVLLAATLWACGDSQAVRIVRVDVSASGKYSLDGQAVAETSLAPKLKELNSSSIALHISANSQASHQSVVGVLDAARDAGIGRILFISPESPTK